MNLFLLTLIAPAMWAFSNHFDKYIVSRYFKDATIGAMMVFSALIALAVLPVAYIFQDQAFSIGVVMPLVLILNGCLYLLAVQLYLMALRISDTSTAVPILQVTPVVSFVLAYWILGESLSSQQMLGGSLIVLGALAISIEMNGGSRPSWRLDVLGLMFLSSFLFALQYLLFKLFAIKTNFWTTMFWESVGFIGFGVFLLMFITSYRRDFFNVFGKGGWVVGINLLGEIANLTGKISFNYVSLLIPITLAWVGVGFQPLFILIYSVILTIFFPHIAQEKVLGVHLAQKAAAVGVMLVGSYILNG
jgi:uncharacterized membrane protein